MDEIIVRYTTTTGVEKAERISVTESRINLDLRETKTVDLLPLIWCTELEELSLRYNKLETIDLSPLSRCPKFRALWLNNNELRELDLTPLAECQQLEEIHLCNNAIKRLDISPLFQCASLQELDIDPDVTLFAEVFLRSVGSWPDVLVERWHQIIWRNTTRFGAPGTQ